MKIILCGSISIAEEILKVKIDLEKNGHEVEIPEGVKRSEIRSGVNSTSGEKADIKIKYDLIRGYYEKIRKYDIVLIVNAEKKGVKGYIGGNTFLEMAFAHVLNKSLYCLYELPQIDYLPEILAMKPIILNGDLNNIQYQHMENKLSAKVSIFINASPKRVWEAITNPDLIKQYLFGTDTSSDWKVGSPITYSGEWDGKKYMDKGVILQSNPGKLLQNTYWSSMSNLPDLPENYQTITNELTSENNGTRLTITQDNNESEEKKNHSEQNWKIVLDGLKKVAEQST